MTNRTAGGKPCTQKDRWKREGCFIAIARVGYMPHASVYACGAYNQPINETVEADARLFATSTKLLEAAEHLVKTWGHGDVTEAVQQLADVIAEAKG